MSRIRVRTRTILTGAALTALVLPLLLGGCRTAPAPEGEEKAPLTKEEKREKAYEEIRASVSKGKPEEAIERFEKSFSATPKELETRLLYSSLLLTGGKLQQAEEVLQGILTDYPENPEALYNLALIRGMQNRGEEQKRLLQKTVAAEKDHADAHASLGEIYMQEEQPEKAAKQFRKSLEIEGSNFTARMGYGHLLLRQGEYEKALSHLNRAVELNPGFSLAYADRGKARAKLEKTKAALEDYDRAVELAPENYWNRIDRGRLLLDLGKMDRAKEDFLCAAELKPDYFLAYVYLAGIYDDREKPEKALANYRKVLELNSDYYPAYEPAAVLHFLNEDYRRAAELYRRMYRRNRQQDPGLALMSALCLMHAGEQEKGRELLGKARSRTEKDDIFYHIARMYLESGYDDYVINELKKVKSKSREMRALFYLAAYYELHGSESLARKYYLEVKEAKLFGLYETRIAEEKMKGAIEEQNG